MSSPKEKEKLLILVMIQNFLIIWHKGHVYKYLMNYPTARILNFGNNYHTKQTGSFSFKQIQQEQ